MSAKVSAFGHRGTTSSIRTEISRELVNATDGAGLHFENNGYVDLGNVTAAKFGTSDFSVEFVLNQTAENVHDNYIYFTNISGKNRAFFRNDLVENQFRITFSNSSSTETSVDIAYDMSADYSTPTHYVVTFDRDGDATLYKNGDSVGSVDISAFSAINLGDDTTQTQRFGSGADYGVLGTFYRFRTWNKIVDAKALYERADVDFADQYGSQTIVIPGDFDGNLDGWDDSNTWNSQTNPSNNMVLVANATGQWCRTAVTLTKGFKYRVTYTASSLTGSPFFGYWNGSPTQLYATSGSTTITAGTNSAEFTLPDDADPTKFYIASGTASDAVTLDNVSVVRIGCVTDYDLAFANPTQSLTVRDRSGTADGTASSSTAVTQVQPVVQLNATAEIIADKLGIGISPAHAATIYGTGAGNATVQIEGEGGADPTINFLTNNTTHWAVGVDDSDSDAFKIVKHSAIGSTNNYVTISSSGLCSFSTGIAFGNQTDTAASGAAVGGTMLDHYERGTFELGDASGAGLTIGNGYGKYTRIGDRVFISIHFDIPSNSSTQTLNLDGLPFAVPDDNDSRGLALNYSDKSGIAYALTPKASSNIFLFTASGGSVTNADASGGGFYINGHYKV